MDCTHHDHMGHHFRLHDVCDHTHSVLCASLPIRDGRGWLLPRRYALPYAVVPVLPSRQNHGTVFISATAIQYYWCPAFWLDHDRIRRRTGDSRLAVDVLARRHSIRTVGYCYPVHAT